MENRITIHGLEEVPAAAEAFLDNIGNIRVVAFSGELGAGKTTFIQALCRTLGVPTDVNSPTFALVNEYFTAEGNPVFHFDLYRIEDPDELFDLGYEDYFFSGKLCLIEWPEMIENLLPENTLRVYITENPDQSRTLGFEI